MYESHLNIQYILLFIIIHIMGRIKIDFTMDFIFPYYHSFFFLQTHENNQVLPH